MTTLQSIYTTVRAYSDAQTKPSRTNPESCRYRMPDGNKCFAGALIEEHEYQPTMEGRTVYGLMLDRLLPQRLVPFVDEIGELQNIHDMHWDTRAEKLDEFAQKYGLT